MAPIQQRQQANANNQFLQAMNDLTKTIKGLQEFYVQQENQARQTLGGSAAATTSTSTPPAPETLDDWAKIKRQEDRQKAQWLKKQPQDESLFGPTVDQYSGPSIDTSYPPDSVQAAEEEAEKTAERSQGMLGNLMNRMPGRSRYQELQGQRSEVQQPQAGDTSNSASMPPQQSGMMFTDPEQAIAWEMMGDAGAPQFLRNFAIRQYGLGQTLNWAQSMAESAGNSNSGVLQSLGVNQESMGRMQDALQVAYENRGPITAAMMGLGSIHDFFGGFQAAGQQFGYGAPAGGQGLFGFRNPLGNISTAAGVGANIEYLQQALQGRMPGSGFGGGLTTAQAHETVNTLASQGFAMQDIIHGLGKGDMSTIAQNMFRPLLNQFPGLSPEELGLFTPALRNAGTSIAQLTDELSNLGGEARSSKLTLNDYVSSLAQVSQQFEGMGASPQGGLAVGRGFTDYTALSPEVAGQFAQSPLVQGLALSQYGVLPSGIGDMNPGAFSNLSLASLQMLQRATSGLNQNVYRMVNGHRVLIEAGQQRQIDQIAQMSGIPSNIVKRMLGDSRGIEARSRAGMMLGSAAEGTGFGYWQAQQDREHGHLTHSQWQQANRDWMDTVANTWQGTGVSRQQMDRIDQIQNLKDRAGAYRQALNQAAAHDKWNQIQQNPNQMTVKVAFTGAAAKYFQQVGQGPTINKAQANAGGTSSMASILNSPAGDLTSPSVQTLLGLGR